MAVVEKVVHQHPGLGVWHTAGGGVQHPSPFQPPFRRIMVQAIHDELCVVVALVWTDGRSAVVEKVVHRYLGPGDLALSWGEVQPPDSLAAPSPPDNYGSAGGRFNPLTPFQLPGHLWFRLYMMS